MRVVLCPAGLISVPLGHGRLGHHHHPHTPPPPCPADAAAEGQERTGGPPWLQVDLVIDVPRPSPAVAFAAIDEACTGLCTAAECQVALRAAGTLAAFVNPQLHHH